MKKCPALQCSATFLLLQNPLKTDKKQDGKMNFISKNTMVSFLIICLFALQGCGGDEIPLKDIEKSLGNVPTYSVVLADMKEEGNFIKEYSHKYRIIQPDMAWDKGWFTVPENFYRANENFLGMAIAGKNNGNVIEAAAPLLYQYVGNPQYGQWRSDGRGGELWAFNRGTPLFDELDIDVHLPVSKKHYRQYKDSLSKKMPFYGARNQYGTKGTFTQKTKPNFFERKMAQQKVQKASFSQKVSSRIGRSKTSFRGRSGSSGK